MNDAFIFDQILLIMSTAIGTLHLLYTLFFNSPIIPSTSSFTPPGTRFLPQTFGNVLLGYNQTYYYQCTIVVRRAKSVWCVQVWYVFSDTIRRFFLEILIQIAKLFHRYNVLKFFYSFTNIQIFWFSSSVLVFVCKNVSK